jgi:hypothetical protein
VVTVRVAEAEAPVEGLGRVVVHLDLQEDPGEAAPGGLLARRRGDGGAQALAAVARVHLDRGEAGPAAGERQPGDREYLAALPDTHERLIFG